MVSNVTTNLGYTASPTNGIVTSSDGTDATIPLATGTNAGLLSPAGFTNLGNQSGTNTGNNAANSTYANDYRAANFIAGTDYEVPLTFGTGLTRTANNVVNDITQYTDALARLSLSSSATGLTYTNTTGVFSLTSGHTFLTTAEQTLWNNTADSIPVHRADILANYKKQATLVESITGLNDTVFALSLIHI